MLEAARLQAAAQVDTVLGFVEPHARPETEALMHGLEIIPSKLVEYRGMQLREFDLDAALARKPALLIVDEFAHTNAPGMRHAKRWQDIQELLDAGINVFTTLNVQHLESLNDVISQVSGIRVRETVPDTVFDLADSIELVDLPPEELQERFREGKVYVPAQAELAIQKFFKLSNLVALRELALRRTADRVDAQVQSAREQTAGGRIWPTRERLLVCIGPSPTSARVIRVASRLAAGLRAPWIAVYVDTGGTPTDTSRQKLTRNLRLAEDLGAETVTLVGHDIAEEIVTYAVIRNVTKIVIGKTGEPRWRQIMGRSIISQVLRRSGDIDVYVIRGSDEPSKDAADRSPIEKRAPEYSRYVKAGLVTVLCTLAAWLMRTVGLSETNQVMVFFLGVAYVAAIYGRGPGVLASVMGVLAFDFFFIPPYFSFDVQDTEYFVTFSVMLAIACLISALAHRIRQQAAMSRRRESRM